MEQGEARGGDLTWSREAIIALVSLFIACGPVGVLVFRVVWVCRRRRRRHRPERSNGMWRSRSMS